MRTQSNGPKGSQFPSASLKDHVLRNIKSKGVMLRKARIGASQDAAAKSVRDRDVASRKLRDLIQPIAYP